MWDVEPNRPTGSAQTVSCKPSAHLRKLPKTGPKVPQAGRERTGSSGPPRRSLRGGRRRAGASSGWWCFAGGVRGGPEVCAGGVADRTVRTHVKGRREPSGAVLEACGASLRSRAEQVGVLAVRWGLAPGVRTALRAGDVLLDRGLRFPADHWGLSAVICGRSTSRTETAVPDAGPRGPVRAP